MSVALRLLPGYSSLSTLPATEFGGRETSAKLALMWSGIVQGNSVWLILLSFLQLLNAVLIGLVAWYFAHQQKKIAQAKLRLDLFDRRFKVFDATRWFVAKAFSLGNLTSEQEREFIFNTIDTEFLFDDELAEYITEIRKHSAALHAFNEMLEGPDPGNAAVRRLEEVSWFSTQADVLPKKFAPFLKLEG